MSIPAANNYIISGASGGGIIFMPCSAASQSQLPCQLLNQEAGLAGLLGSQEGVLIHQHIGPTYIFGSLPD